MEPLHFQAKALMTARPTCLFHRRHPGCTYPLSVLVEVAARRIFSLSNAFGLATPRRNKEEYARISDLAVMAVNELALAHSTLKNSEGEDNPTGEWAEWAVFKHHTLVKPAKSALPHILIKALYATVHPLYGYLASSSRPPMTTAAQHVAAALRNLLDIEAVLDEISATAYRPVKWPSRQRKNRRVES